MKEYKEEQVCRTKEVLIKRICDICSRKTTNEDNWFGNPGFDVGETTVKFRKGTCYPECSDGIKIEIDICHECFEKKLIPWVQSQNEDFEVVEEEYSW